MATLAGVLSVWGGWGWIWSVGTTPREKNSARFDEDCREKSFMKIAGLHEVGFWTGLSTFHMWNVE